MLMGIMIHPKLEFPYTDQKATTGSCVWQWMTLGAFNKMIKITKVQCR